MKRRSLAAAAAFVGLFAASQGYAAIVTYEFSGSVSSVYGDITSITTGTAFSATLMYDTTKQLPEFTSSVQADYIFSAGGYQFNLSLGSGATIYAGSSSGGRISILNDFSGPPPQDWFQTRSTFVDGFSGTAVDGMVWRQSDITLKNLGGTLYSNTDLPSSIAALNNFGEAFATLYFGEFQFGVGLVGPQGLLNVQINQIEAILTNSSATSLVANQQSSLLSPGAPGALTVTAPSEGTFSASYSQQAKGEVDFESFNFFIPGSIFQVWELTFTGEIGAGESVELVFNYDDRGMTPFDELLLDIFHEYEQGKFRRLFGVVDPNANTITARTSSFSPFYLGTVPEPSSILLIMAALGMLAVGRSRRSQVMGSFSSHGDTPYRRCCLTDR